jgi:hypothetical protein
MNDSIRKIRRVIFSRLVCFYLIYIATAGMHLYAQCELREAEIAEDKFRCQTSDVRAIHEQWDSFCKDSSSVYHFIYYKLPSTNYYSLIIEHNKSRFKSELGEVHLTRRMANTLNDLLSLVSSGKWLIQVCDEDVKFGEQVLESLTIKVDGKLSLIYQSDDKNADPIRISKDARLKPIINLLQYMDEISGHRDD